MESEFGGKKSKQATKTLGLRCVRLSPILDFFNVQLTDWRASLVAFRADEVEFIDIMSVNLQV